MGRGERSETGGGSEHARHDGGRVRRRIGSDAGSDRVEVVDRAGQPDYLETHFSSRFSAPL